VSDRVVLAYSGGLDTSVAIGWIAEVTGAEVIAVANPDVARGHIRVRSDVPKEFAHECLAETHDFEVALPLRIEVGPALGATHRQRRERVLEHLLESEELENAEVDRRMEPQPAFVGADRAVHLDTESAVDVDVALIVLPRDAEHDHALRLDDPLEDLGLAIFRMTLENERERLDHFLDGLVKLRLRRVLRLNFSHQR